VELNTEDWAKVNTGSVEAKRVTAKLNVRIVSRWDDYANIN